MNEYYSAFINKTENFKNNFLGQIMMTSFNYYRKKNLNYWIFKRFIENVRCHHEKKKKKFPRRRRIRK